MIFCPECGEQMAYEFETPQGIGVFPPDSDFYLCPDCGAGAVVLDGEVLDAQEAQDSA